MKIVPLKNRIMPTVNASKDDAVNIYKFSLMCDLRSHYQGFFPNEDLCDEIQDHLKKIKIKSHTSASFLDRHYMSVTTIDNIRIEFQDIMHEITWKKVPKEFKDVEMEIFKLCNKHDGGMPGKIVETFHKVLNQFWGT